MVDVRDYVDVVARLYDRLLAHGSRPVTGYDLMAAAAKVNGEDFDATLRSGSIEALLQQETCQ